MADQEKLMLVSRYDCNKVKELRPYRHITFQEALPLRYGTRVKILDRQGTVAEVKINGKVRTWKRDANRIEIPCKYGLYEYFTLTKDDYQKILIEI